MNKPTAMRIGRRVEEPVPQGVRLQPGQGRGRMVSGGTHHVVPLKDLMQDDPIEEAAQADTEDARHGDTGHCGPPPWLVAT